MRRKMAKIPPLPLTLADSWLDGFCDDAKAAFAVKRTQDELKAAGITESQARAVRDELESIFEQWHSENMHRMSVEPPSGLLGHFDLAAAESYPWASYPFDSYAALLNELHADKYPPLTALSTKHGFALAAALTLAEAAAGRFESARRVREDMDWVLLEIERDRTKALTNLLRKILPAARKHWNSAGGSQKRQDQEDKRKFIALAKPYRGTISTVADLRGHPELAYFLASYRPGGYQTETLRDWLKEAGIELKPGRPRKT